jgi:electron transfer flavoprotein alpha subunit
VTVVLVFVEDAGDELSQQALTFARGLGDELQAVSFGSSEYAPAGWAAAIVELVSQRAPGAVIAPGTDRGNELLAHVAARLDLPMAANACR